MKKMFLLFFFVSTFFSFSSGQPLVDNWGFASLKIDSSAMKSACEIYAQYFVDSSQKEKFFYDCADGNGIGFNSLLDSTVRVYFTGNEIEQALEMTRTSQDCVGPYPEDSTAGTPGTHQFSEVMLFELLRLQECGIIEMRRDSLETLLLSAILQVKAKNKKCPDLDWGVYGETSGAGDSPIGPGCCSLVESSTAIPRVSKISRDIRAEKVSAGKFRLWGVTLGAEVSVFDLNGKVLLRKNFDGGLLEIPNVPSVVRMRD